VSTTVRTNVDSRNTGLTDGNFYPNTYTLIPLHNEYQAFLPSLNLVYSVNDEVRLRGSISRTMTRPNYSSMIGSVNFAISDASSATLPNPYLKPFFSNNIDLGVEVYTGAEGYIGVDVFRKGISGFTTSTNTTVPFRSLAQYGITYDSLAIVTKAALDAKGGPDAATVVVSQSVNQPGLQTINGLEITYVQPLDILLEQYGLKGFGFTGNLTIVDQSSTGAAPTFATGIPPYTYNVSAYYENHGIMVRATYVYSDKTYTSASNVQGVCLPSVSMLAANCPGGAYLRGAPYGQLDFSSSLDLSNIFGELPSDPQLTFDVQNLMHSKRRTYDQWSNATNTYYDAGSVFLFGVRGRF
jgi:TonB-dependent receptor